MIWIEMSRDEIHGGDEWGFTKCLWSPAYKRGTRKGSWLFWTNILNVQQGDIVLHLRGKGRLAAFIGYSIAATNGHETSERPPQAGEWDYAVSYFRAMLRDYQEFQVPILLEKFFASHKEELITYLQELSVTPANRFFAYQSKRLQCLNGAYLSICDEKLLDLIFNKNNFNDTFTVTKTASTDEVLREVRQRVGQTQFAEGVKKNYQYKCCFPDCKIDDPKFLIASHISRWADNPEKRGNISNGLCFCVLHDKAFENGYFSLDDDCRVVLSCNPFIRTSIVFIDYLMPYEHRKIDSAIIMPDKAALKEHRSRCKFGV